MLRALDAASCLSESVLSAVEEVLGPNSKSQTPWRMSFPWSSRSEW